MFMQCMDASCGSTHGVEGPCVHGGTAQLRRAAHLKETLSEVRLEARLLFRL
jgi:hypothetical protein